MAGGGDRAMTHEYGDLLVQVRFKNAILYRALVEQFGSIAEKMMVRTGYPPVVRIAAEEMGVGMWWLAGVLNLKKRPMNAFGKWSDYAVKVAECLALSPEELFPHHLYQNRFSRRLEFTANPEMVALSEARSIAAPDMTDAVELKDVLSKTIASLAPRQQNLLKLRFGLDGEVEHTLREVGKALGVSLERARHMEARALRDLRHPSRLRLLNGYVPYKKGSVVPEITHRLPLAVVFRRILSGETPTVE